MMFSAPWIGAARFLVNKLRALLLFALTVALFVQSFYLVILLLGPQEALPQRHQQHLQEFFTQHQLSFSAKQLIITPHFSVHARDIEIRDMRTGLPLLSARTAYARLNLWDLFYGRFRPSKIIVRDLVVHSFRLRRNSTLCDLRHLQILWDRAQGWDVELIGAAAAIDFRIRGEVPEAWLGTAGNRNIPWQQEYLKLQDGLDRLENFVLDYMEEPFIWGNLDGALHLEICAAQTRYERAKLGRTLFWGTLGPSADSWNLQGPYYIASERIEVPDFHLSAQRLWLEASAGEKITDGFDQLRFSIPTASFKDQPIEGIKGSAHWVSKGNLAVDAALNHGNNWVAARSVFALSDTQWAVDLEAYLNPLSLKRFVTKSELAQFFDCVEFEQRYPLLQGRVEFNQMGLNRADGWIQAQTCLVRQRPLLWAQIGIEYMPELLVIGPVWAVGPNWSANATYSLNISQMDGFLSAWGNLDPAFLAPWMGPWWNRLWEDFSFKKDQPCGWVEIYTPWKDPNSLSIFGVAQAQDFTFRSVDVPGASVGLRIAYNEVALTHVCIEDSVGQGTGRVRWLFEDEYADPVRVDVDIASDLPLRYVGMLEKPKRLLEYLEPTLAPHVAIKGSVYPMRQASSGLFVDFNEEKPLVFGEAAEFDYLSFQAQLSGDSLIVSPLDFGIAQGRCSGNLELSKLELDGRLEIALNLPKMRTDLLIEKFHPLRFMKNPSADRVSAKLRKSSFTQHHGEISLNFQGIGLLDNLDSWVGAGHVLLEEPDLGNVHFFGALFKLVGALASLPTGGPDNSVDIIKGNFNLNKSVLYFPQAQVSGDTYNLDVHGQLGIKDHSLNFDMQLHPFERVPLLAVAFVFLRPLTYVFQIHLTGTLTNPQWTVGPGSSQNTKASNASAGKS